MLGRNRLAITYTAKNEEDLLRHAIPYHLRLGCEKIYLFLDGSTDSSRLIASSFDDVECLETVHPHELENPPQWIRKISDRWGESVTVRKRINTYHAARLAAREGIDWISCIDADELLLPDLKASIDQHSLSTLLSDVPRAVDQILVRNLELVPHASNVREPFEECTLFLNRFPFTEHLWRLSRFCFGKICKDLRKRASFDHIYYKVRFQGALPRLMRHPTTGEVIPFGYFLGYSNFKSIVRTSSAELLNFNVHKWISDAKKVRSVYRGLVLHYDLFNAEYLMSKFRQRPESIRFFGDYHRNELAHIARELPDEIVAKFFRENIVISDEELIEMLLRRGILMRIDSIAQCLSRRDCLSAPDQDPRTEVA